MLGVIPHDTVSLRPSWATCCCQQNNNTGKGKSYEAMPMGSSPCPSSPTNPHLLHTHSGT